MSTGRLRLAGETGDERGVAGQLLVEYLEREITVQGEIDGFVHRTHAADADYVQQQEITELQWHNRKRAAMLAFNMLETGLAGQIENRPAGVAVDGVWHFAWCIHDRATLARVGKGQQQQTQRVRCPAGF